jgi:hypothetical protein
MDAPTTTDPLGRLLAAAARAAGDDSAVSAWLAGLASPRAETAASAPPEGGPQEGGRRPLEKKTELKGRRP